MTGRDGRMDTDAHGAGAMAALLAAGSWPVATEPLQQGAR